MVFLGKDNGSVRPVPQPNGGAQQWGGTLLRCPRRRQDMEEGSSSGKKWKRKEDEEAAEVEFSLMVEELWGRVARRWEELEWRQEQRWATMMATLGHIADDVWELLDRLVLEEKEKGQEKGVKMGWRWRKWRSRGRQVRGRRRTGTEKWRWRKC